MRATRLERFKLAASLTLPIQSQVLACASLCSLGATLGLITILGEMGYHFVTPTRGPAYSTAALCAGIVLGLWMPRRIIRRRLARGNTEGLPADLAAPGGLKLEFAASLSGALIVTFALTWVVLCGGAVVMEEYRAFLSGRFLCPIWLLYLLLSAPACAGLMFAGATGTTLLLALHGWYRLVTQPNTNIARLWTSILLGALAAGLLAYQAASPTVLAWLAPLTVFIAGMISVFRRAEGVGRPSPQPTRPTLPRDEWLSLLAVGLAAAATGAALTLTIPSAWTAPRALAMEAAVLAGGACAGMFVARLLFRLRFSAGLGALALLLAAVTLLLPYQLMLAPSVNLALVRLAAVTGCATACVVLLGGRLAQSSRSVQYALSWVGRFAAVGFGSALPLTALGATRWSPATLAMLTALVATAGAGLVLILDSRTKTPTRAAGLICIGLWLAGVPSATHFLAEASRVPGPAARPPAERPHVDLARRLVMADTFHTSRVQPLPPFPDSPTAWQFDLAGPALDLVILEGTGGADDWSVGDPELGRRLLRRVTSRLARGGRLLVELPTPPFLTAALSQFNPPAAQPAWRAFRLRVRGETDEYEALVFGSDIPALIRRNTPLCELEVTLQPLHTSIGAGR